jgi:hypothetical protein
MKEEAALEELLKNKFVEHVKELSSELESHHSVQEKHYEVLSQETSVILRISTWRRDQVRDISKAETSA